jgi:aspartyl-tRNA(Asn)/glutamyl-tRNA(Gln) amidotransferase subunit A
MTIQSAFDIKEQFLSGKTSAEKIVQTHLDKISQIDPKVHAFLAVFSQRALEKAKALDKKKENGSSLGKLAGIPIALKDNMHVKGEVTTCGSKILENYCATFDATITRLIEEEDGIVIGKTNLDEFAMGSSMENSAFFLSNNPWNLQCTPGGSSGGSAVAVAARLCPLSLGSDTGGSIRQPAAFCGLVGFKPTYGRISRYGLVAFGSSLDQIGPFATCVKDAALMMEVLGKHCKKDSTSLDIPQENFLGECGKSIQGKKIGVPRSFLQNLHPESAQNFEDSLKIFESLGATIVELDLPILKYSLATYYILSTAEAATNLARYDGIRYGYRSKEANNLSDIYDLSREDGFGDEVKNRILLGTYVLSSGHKGSFYNKAQKVRTLFIEAFAKAFTSCDVIAMPTTPEPAFKFGAIQSTLQMYLQDIFTTPANLAGLPAMSLPSGLTKNNMPLGLQLVGPVLQDRVVFRFASAFEKAMAPLKDKYPEIT